MEKTLTEQFMEAFKKAHHWHDYQDHCHNCGQEDARKYPYCVPYEAVELIKSLVPSSL